MLIRRYSINQYRYSAMSVKRISLLVLVILPLVAALMLWVGNPFMAPPDIPSVEPARAPDDFESAPKPAAPLVNLQERIQALQSPPPLMPEQIEEERQTTKELVAAALWELNSGETAQRIAGAEQLAAYPTLEAEAALTQVLTGDPEAEVRSMAAQSLGSVKKPSDATLTALMGVLEDENEDVRQQALLTLQRFLVGSDERTERHRKILAGLKASADSRSTPRDIRKALRDILEDQPRPSL